MCQLPAAQPLVAVNGRFPCSCRTAPDPQETFVISTTLRQVLERSGRSGHGEGEFYSAWNV